MTGSGALLVFTAVVWVEVYDVFAWVLLEFSIYWEEVVDCLAWMKEVFNVELADNVELVATVELLAGTIVLAAAVAVAEAITADGAEKVLLSIPETDILIPEFKYWLYIFAPHWAFWSAVWFSVKHSTGALNTSLKSKSLLVKSAKLADWQVSFKSFKHDFLTGKTPYGELIPQS